MNITGMRFILPVLVIFVAGIGLSVETDCPDYWVAFGQSCYFFGTENPASFVESEHFCEQIGGHLVRIDSAAENTFLKNYLRENKHGHTWMGLTDIMSEGRWLWQGTYDSPQYTDWYPGEPNNRDNREDCADFMVPSYQWNDTPCSGLLEPLCERTPGGIIVG